MPQLQLAPWSRDRKQIPMTNPSHPGNNFRTHPIRREGRGVHRPATASLAAGEVSQTFFGFKKPGRTADTRGEQHG